MSELSEVPATAVYCGRFFWRDQQLLFQSDGSILVAELIPQEPANDEKA